MATVLYRKNGGEVLKFSRINQSFDLVDAEFYGVLIDPDAPDGTDIRERLPMRKFGPMRVFGFAKKALPAQNRIRNATQAEINAFDTQEGVDEQKLDTKQAKRQLDEHPYLGRMLRAVVRRIVMHIIQNNVRTNQMLNQWQTFKDVIVTSNNLRDDLKNFVSSAPDVPNDLPESVDFPDLLRRIKEDIKDTDVPRRRIVEPVRSASRNPLRMRLRS